MPDPSTGREKVYPVGRGELFNLGILGEVCGGFVLDVVVECEDGLTRVEDFGALEGGESGGARRGSG
jgi:hypothetical protein